ncbi:MAG: ATP-binding cassette domain-containing protein [Ruminococcaceae bacterium]|nr:ATP-binding cassette domain-containing protein [Oscillospiraceae bacterium]
MIEIKSLTKVFGDKTAVDNLTFEVHDGEIVGFLGPNGAGKSTTMNILTGYLSATSGSAKINGADVFEDPKRAKQNIGFLPELPPLYLDMTVLEYLKFVYELKGAKQRRNKHLDEICTMTGIKDVKNRVIKNLSKGYRQRVGIAQALVGDPRVLIFDEPTVGLDPNQIIEIRNLIKALGKKHTVILSTHILSEVQAVCDRIIIINKGKIALDSPTDKLLTNTAGVMKYRAKLACSDSNTAVKLVSSVDGVMTVTPVESSESGVCEVIFESDPLIDTRKCLFNTLSAKGVALMGLESVTLTLEDIFTRLTTEKGVK